MYFVANTSPINLLQEKYVRIIITRIFILIYDNGANDTDCSQAYK